MDNCLVFKLAGGKIVKHTTYLDPASVLRRAFLLSIEGARPEAA